MENNKNNGKQVFILSVVIFIMAASIGAIALYSAFSTLGLVNQSLEINKKISTSNALLIAEVENLQKRVSALEEKLANEGYTEETRQNKKYDSLYIGDLENANSLDVSTEKVALMSDSNDFAYYESMMQNLEVEKVLSFGELTGYGLGDTIIIHTDLTDEWLVELYNTALEHNFTSPNIIVLLKAASDSEKAYRIENLIKPYTELCCNTMTDITVYFTDGLKREYQYYVE